MKAVKQRADVALSRNKVPADGVVAFDVARQ
jgi:hypothetical protein